MLLFYCISAHSTDAFLRIKISFVALSDKNRILLFFFFPFSLMPVTQRTFYTHHYFSPLFQFSKQLIFAIKDSLPDQFYRLTQEVSKKKKKKKWLCVDLSLGTLNQWQNKKEPLNNLLREKIDKRHTAKTDFFIFSRKIFGKNFQFYSHMRCVKKVARLKLYWPRWILSSEWNVHFLQNASYVEKVGREWSWIYQDRNDQWMKHLKKKLRCVLKVSYQSSIYLGTHIFGTHLKKQDCNNNPNTRHLRGKK